MERKNPRKRKYKSGIEARAKRKMYKRRKRRREKIKFGNLLLKAVRDDKSIDYIDSLVKNAIEKRFDIKKIQKFQVMFRHNTLLHIASKNGNYKIVEYLLPLFKNINIMNDNKETPLLLASRNNHEKIVELLLNNGADTNICNSSENTPLIEASYNNNEKIVKLLIDKKANINHKNYTKDSPLIIFSKNGNQKMVKLLLDYKANVNIKDGDENTPLIIASQNENEEIVKLLLDYKANVNLYNKDEGRALEYSIINVNEKIIELLLKNNATIGISEMYEVTNINNEKIVKLLFDYGANPNIIYDNDVALFLSIVENNNIKIIKLFLDYGANANVKGEDTEKGKIPLTYAFYNNNEEVIKLLLDKGAIVVNITGSIPFIMEKKNEKTIELLLKYYKFQDPKVIGKIGKLKNDEIKIIQELFKRKLYNNLNNFTREDCQGWLSDLLKEYQNVFNYDEEIDWLYLQIQKTCNSEFKVNLNLIETGLTHWQQLCKKDFNNMNINSISEYMNTLMDIARKGNLKNIKYLNKKKLCEKLNQDMIEKKKSMENQTLIKCYNENDIYGNKFSEMDQNLILKDNTYCFTIEEIDNFIGGGVNPYTTQPFTKELIDQYNEKRNLNLENIHEVFELQPYIPFHIKRKQLLNQKLLKWSEDINYLPIRKLLEMNENGMKNFLNYFIRTGSLSINDKDEILRQGDDISRLNKFIDIMNFKIENGNINEFILGNYIINYFNNVINDVQFEDNIIVIG